MKLRRTLSVGASLCFVIMACGDDVFLGDIPQADGDGSTPNAEGGFSTEGGLFDGSGSLSDTGSDAPVDGPSDSAVESGGDASGDAASDAASDAAASDAAVSDAAVSDARSDAASGDAGALVCGGCPAGMKYCDEKCVAIDDPRYGCAATVCSPCPSRAQVASAKCSAGACVVDRCFDGFSDCNRDFGDGCEGDLGKPGTCGSCSNACAANQVCNGTACAASCPFPKTDCNRACRDLSSDPSACGSCDRQACDAQNGTATCSGGVCGLQCDNGFTKCGAVCVNLTTDNARGLCGACNSGCSSPAAYGNTNTCSNSVCVRGCAPGFASCAGVCVNRNSDRAHCGSCGNACGGGQVCLDGSCVAPSALRVVTGLTTPEDIAVDATNIYWTDIGTNEVWKANKVTFAKTRLASNQAKPFRIAVDSQFIYWSSNLGGAILRVPISGGTPVVLYSANSPTGLAVDADNVYWSDTGAATLYRAPKAGGAGAPVALTGPASCSAGTFANACNADELKIDATRIYGERRSSGIFGVAKTTGQVTQYYNSPNIGTVWGIAIDSTRAHWVRSSGGVLRVHSSDKAVSAVNENPTKGIAADLLAMTADDCGVYWTDGKTTIWKLDSAALIGGSELSPQKLSVAGTATRRIVLDDTYAYWTDAGWIGRARK